MTLSGNSLTRMQRTFTSAPWSTSARPSRRTRLVAAVPSGNPRELRDEDDMLAPW